MKNSKPRKVKDFLSPEHLGKEILTKNLYLAKSFGEVLTILTDFREINPRELAVKTKMDRSTITKLFKAKSVSQKYAGVLSEPLGIGAEFLQLFSIDPNSMPENKREPYFGIIEQIVMFFLVNKEEGKHKKRGRELNSNRLVKEY